MKLARLSFVALLASASVLVASCGDSNPLAPSTPVAVAPAMQNSLLGDVVQGLNHTVGDLLLTCSPLPASSVSKTIGPAGGIISVGPHNLLIPPGALAHNTTITASIVNGGHNGVHFEPHGLQFQRSAALTMSYANCSGLGMLLGRHIVYVDGHLNILEQLLGLDDLWSKNVVAKLDHFSDYMISY